MYNDERLTVIEETGAISTEASFSSPFLSSYIRYFATVPMVRDRNTDMSVTKISIKQQTERQRTKMWIQFTGFNQLEKKKPVDLHQRC